MLVMHAGSKRFVVEQKPVSVALMKPLLALLFVAGCTQSPPPPTLTPTGPSAPAAGTPAEPVADVPAPATPPVVAQTPPVAPTPVGPTPTTPPVVATPTTPTPPAGGGRRAFPECLQAKYDSYVATRKKTDPAASVTRYTYNGQTVWMLPAPCCDQFNTVYDTSCKVVCAPSGGITGKGDGKCPDFFGKATDQVVVWPR